MSTAEQATTTSALSATAAALVAGSGNVVCSGLFNGISRIIGITRKTSGGTPGTISILSTTGSAAGAAQATTVQLRSSNALDTSVYTIWWVNEVGPGLLAA